MAALSHCSEAVEHLIIKCRPHYLLREFTAVLIIAVYITTTRKCQCRSKRAAQHSVTYSTCNRTTPLTLSRTNTQRHCGGFQSCLRDSQRSNSISKSLLEATIHSIECIPIDVLSFPPPPSWLFRSHHNHAGPCILAWLRLSTYNLSIYFPYSTPSRIA